MITDTPSSGPQPSQRLRAGPGLRRMAVAAMAMLLVGCATFAPRSVTISQADLQARLERQFPRQQRVLELIDITVARPTLRLLPERDRIATDLELVASERLGGRTARGNLSLDYGLRYEPSDATVRLTQVRVQQFELELGSSGGLQAMNRVGALLAERMLDDFTIYRLTTERAQRLRDAGVAGVQIKVTPHGVEITPADPR